MLFFQGLWVVLCHFFDGARGFVDDRGSVFNHGFSGRCFGGSSCCSGGCLGFFATTAHFTWIVRRTTIFGQGAGTGPDGADR